MFAGNFAPRGWAFCQGQTLAIASNTALFSILGTTYGGNGQTTFMLPDFRSRVAVGAGQGPGLSSYNLGQAAGVESETLTINQMPAHFHTVAPACNSDDGTEGFPEGNCPAAGGKYAATPNNSMKAYNSGNTGGSNPVPILQPYLGMNYIICIEGIYPSRN